MCWEWSARTDHGALLCHQRAEVTEDLMQLVNTTLNLAYLRLALMDQRLLVVQFLWRELSSNGRSVQHSVKHKDVLLKKLRLTLLRTRVILERDVVVDCELDALDDRPLARHAQLLRLLERDERELEVVRRLLQCRLLVRL